MMLFAFFSIIFSLFTSAVLFYIFRYKRYLIVKPSIWFLTFFHIIIQWSSTIYVREVTERLNNLEPFFVLTQGLPVILSIYSLLSYRRSSLSISNRIKVVVGKQLIRPSSIIRIIIINLIIAFVIVIIYLQFVPFKETGLFHSITGSSAHEAKMAREMSAKLLKQQWLKYLYSFYAKFLASFTVSLLVLYGCIKRYRISWVWIFMSIFLITFFAILPGARGPGARILFVGLATYLFYNIEKFKFGKSTILGAFILIPPIYLQMATYNRSGFTAFFVAAEEMIFRRILFVPIDVGLYWLAYIEDHGYWGSAAIPKLASIVGVSPVHVPNYMMRYTFPGNPDNTGYMTSSFVFAYFSYFGWFGVILCLLIS